jgi:hypothetical protein
VIKIYQRTAEKSHRGVAHRTYRHLFESRLIGKRGGGRRGIRGWASTAGGRPIQEQNFSRSGRRCKRSPGERAEIDRKVARSCKEVSPASCGSSGRQRTKALRRAALRLHCCRTREEQKRLSPLSGEQVKSEVKWKSRRRESDNLELLDEFKRAPAQAELTRMQPSLISIAHSGSATKR